jgi:hypothetical protein
VTSRRQRYASGRKRFGCDREEKRTDIFNDVIPSVAKKKKK